MHRGRTTEYSPAQEVWLYSISTPRVSISTAEGREDLVKGLQDAN